MRPIDKPVVPAPSPVDFLASNFVRSAPRIAQTAAANNFFNPVSSIAQAVGQGRLPNRGEVGTDAAFAAVGMLPFGKGARPVLETTEAIAARLGAISRRTAPEGGPTAVSQFLGAPKTGYHETLNRDVLNQTLNSGEQVIPRGMELIRMPSAGQVTPSQYSQSVPLPREIGADYLAGRPQSFGQSADLQKMGAIMRGMAPDTGGAIWRNPGLMSITAMEDLPGLIDLPAFLAKYSDEIAPSYRHPLDSDFLNEGLLSPDVRLQVRDFSPGDINTFPLNSPTGMGQFNFPTWYLNAYAR